MRSVLFVSMVAATLGASEARAQQPSKEEELRSEIERLSSRLGALEKSTTQGTPAVAPASTTLGWKDLISDGNKFQIYGFARLDAQYDDSRPNNTQTIGWILSEDDNPPGGAPNSTLAGGDDKEDFTMHPRLSRLGFNFDGGTVSSLDDAKVTGKIEIDFFNNGLAGQSESRAALRMRHAYLKMGWGDFSVLFGQTTDVISPIFPVVNADLVMWGAGNLGDRRPQIRPEYTRKNGDLTWIFQGEIGLTGANDNADIDPAGSIGAGYRDGETSGRPTIQARAACKFPIEKRASEVGVWLHNAVDEPDDAANAIPGSDRFDSNAIGLDVQLPLFHDDFSLKAEVWTGENLDDVRGGIFQGINTVTGDEIDSRGGFLELGWKANENLSLHLGFSNDNPENDDVPNFGRNNNEIWYVASRWVYKPVSFGLEVLDWTTSWNGLEDGDDLRIVGYAQYSF